MSDVPDLATLRQAHAPEPYEFPTKQTYCRASDGPTDGCDVCALLDRLAALEAERERVVALAVDLEERKEIEWAHYMAAGSSSAEALWQGRFEGTELAWKRLRAALAAADQPTQKEQP